MTADLVAPALLALMAATAGGWLRRRVPPRVALTLLTALSVLGATAVLWALALVVVGGLIGVPEVMKQLGWCNRVLTRSHQAPIAVAITAGALLSIGIARALRFERRWRRTTRRYAGSGGLEIVSTDDKVAFAAPGRPGTVVVSSGLLSILSDEEQTAVIAHEMGHLSQHHARYLRIAGIAAAAVPLMTPLTRQLRFATERAADEAAAAVVGDRRVVARAITRAALATSTIGLLAVGGDSVGARVSELLRPPRPAWLPVAAVLTGCTAAAAAVLASTLQLHHLVAFGAHVCGIT